MSPATTASPSFLKLPLGAEEALQAALRGCQGGSLACEPRAIASYALTCLMQQGWRASEQLAEVLLDRATELLAEEDDERCIACGKPGDRLQASGAYSLCGPCEDLAKQELRS